MSLKRDSANLIIAANVVDYYDLDATTKAPAAVIGATVTGRVFDSVRAAQLGADVVLVPESDQLQNTYRGILPATVNLSDHESVWIRYEVDAGDEYATSVSWVEQDVVDV